MGLGLIIDNYKKKLQGPNKDLFFDSVFALIVRVGAAISAFLMNMVVARQLKSYQAGNFFLCFAVITVLATFLRLGGDNLLIRYVSINGHEGKWKAVKLIVRQVLKRVMIFSAVIIIILLLLCPVISKDVFHKQVIENTLFWMLLSTPLLAIYTLLSYAIQGLRKVIFSVSIQNIFVPVILSIFILIIKPSSADQVAKLYFVASLITTIISVYFWRKFVLKGDVSEAPHLPDHFWKSSYTLWLFTMVQMAMQWGGQFIAGIFCTQKQIAQLAVAQRTSMLISFILIAINLVSAPRFASLYKEGKMKNLKRYAINTTRVMVVFSTPIVLFIICFPGFIMSLFGSGFQEGAPMLVVLALGQFVNVLTGSVTLLLMMSGHEKDMRNIQVVMAIFSTILNLVLIKYYGAYGAAIATAVSIAMQNLICVGMVQKRLGFNTLAIWSKG